MCSIFRLVPEPQRSKIQPPRTALHIVGQWLFRPPVPFVRNAGIHSEYAIRECRPAHASGQGYLSARVQALARSLAPPSTLSRAALPGRNHHAPCKSKRGTSAVKPLWLLVSASLLAGCATNKAPDFGGKWKAVNRYASSTVEIPLYQSYVFAATPMDGTLKSMLGRWARDSKITLSYLHPSDFTLYAPVAQIHTDDLQQAVSQLTAAYAAHDVSIVASNNQIVVRAAQETQVEAPIDKVDSEIP